jgi:hypothetical protein
MEGLTGDSGTLFLFLYLLPGFIGLQVYDYLAVARKREIFEKLVIAFSLTAISAIVVNFVFGVPLVPQVAPERSVSGVRALLAALTGSDVEKAPALGTVLATFIGRNLLYLSIVSSAVSALFAVLNNRGLLYGWARSLGLTYKTGTLDVWEAMFYGLRGTWLRIRFDDGVRLVGWPEFISDPGVARELFLAEATWYYPDPNRRGRFTRVDVDGPGVYVSRFDRIVSIEALE